MSKADLKPKALKPYSLLTASQGTLIPLNHWDYVDNQKRERGKSPAHANWMKRSYRDEGFDPEAWMADKGKNVGFRPTHSTLILDIDPRNGGDEGFKQLMEDLGIPAEEQYTWPHVITGSGGSHYYMTKDKDTPVKDSLEDYPGVEFKSFGRQVVAAGSKHPNGTLYEWDALGGEIDEILGLPAAPDTLMRLIARPIATHDTVTGAGEYDQEQLATMLDGLDPENYKDQEAWFTLMQACHHATAGDGRSEFIEWSTRDPDFADHAWQIGRRWDSLHAGKEGGITYRTLFKELNDAGKSGLIPRTDNDPNEDFASIEEAEFKQILTEGDSLSDKMRNEEAEPNLLDLMNQKYFMTQVGGTTGGTTKTVVGYFEKDPHEEYAGREYCKYMSRDNFRQVMSNKKVQLNPDKIVGLADVWLDWQKRRTYKGTLFDPSNRYKGKKFLNLWRGWPYEPRKGDCSLFYELVYEVLAAGDQATGDYILDWTARMFQKPQHQGDVALVFPGARGIGKSTFGEILLKMTGANGMMVADSNLLAGEFNYHLHDKIFLFADEAINPRDFERNSRIKALITSHQTSYHEKGQTPFMGHNCIHVVMATNDDWAVSSAHDERRYMVTRPSDAHKMDTPWFKKLWKQMNNGGYEALLFDMLHRDIKEFDHFQYPQTAEGLEQKLRSLDPFAKWIYELLETGRTPADIFYGGPWDLNEKVSMPVRGIKDAFKYWCHDRDLKAGSNEKLSTRVMKKRLVEMFSPHHVGVTSRDVPDEDLGYEAAKMDCFVWPGLADCRDGFESYMKHSDLFT